MNLNLIDLKVMIYDTYEHLLVKGDGMFDEGDEEDFGMWNRTIILH